MSSRVQWKNIPEDEFAADLENGSQTGIGCQKTPGGNVDSK